MLFFRAQRINQKKSFTVAWDLWERDIELDGHLLLASRVHHERGLDADGAVVKEFAEQENYNDECTGQGHYWESA